MGYYPDLSLVAIEEFKKKLKKDTLLPSQKILLEDIDNNFDYLKADGITNMAELAGELKSKKKVEEFSKKSGIKMDYLLVLRREVNSYQSRARKIKDFSCINDEIKNKLEICSIKTTADLYDFVRDASRRAKLEKDLGIGSEEVMLLTRLTDLSRIRYVNPAFAVLLVNSSYDTAEKIRNADHMKLYDELIKVNEGKRYFRGNIGLKDMDFFVKDSLFYSPVIEY